MRYIIALATLPVAALVITRPAPSPRIVARAVATEGVRAARQDDTTFRLRWSVVADMPPATAIKIAEQAAAEPEQPEVQNSIPTPRPRPARIRRAVPHLDLCQRHKMRKVWFGRRWRCRR